MSTYVARQTAADRALKAAIAQTVRTLKKAGVPGWDCTLRTGERVERRFWGLVRRRRAITEEVVAWRLFVTDVSHNLWLTDNGLICNTTGGQRHEGQLDHFLPALDWIHDVEAAVRELAEREVAAIDT